MKSSSTFGLVVIILYIRVPIIGNSSRYFAILDCFVGDWFRIARSSGLSSMILLNTSLSLAQAMIVKDPERPLAITSVFWVIMFLTKSVISWTYRKLV